MNRSRTALGLAASVTPAVLGAFLLGKALGSEANMTLAVALGMGALVGFTALAAGRSRSWAAAFGAGASAVLGSLLGFLLDVRWNSALHAARQLAEERPELDAHTARQIAETIVSGSSFFELLQGRLHPASLLVPLFAALGAVLAVRSGLLARAARVSTGGGSGAEEEESGAS